jgi:DNA-directed RNA polymerase subunit RPC12/RpoP
MIRKAIGTQTRFEIFKRDYFMCQYCGATPPHVVLHVDRIITVALGGEKLSDNLITACQPCNQGKAARPLTNVPKSLADKASEVEEREAQIAGYAEIMEAARARLEQDTWRVAEVLSPRASDGYSRSKFDSIKKFIGMIGVLYFCGICWRKSRDLTDGGVQ